MLDHTFFNHEQPTPPDVKNFHALILVPSQRLETGFFYSSPELEAARGFEPNVFKT